MIVDDLLLSEKMQMMNEMVDEYFSELRMAMSDLADRESRKAIEISFDFAKKTVSTSDVFDISELKILDAVIDDSAYLINIDGTLYVINIIAHEVNKI
ncbi:MAG: hypothetical protein QXF15_04100 [Candidatus Aenigmatarchaeota archaeon]